MHRPCTCKEKHKPVKGKAAKASAVYTPGLVPHLGTVLSQAIRARAVLLQGADHGPERICPTDLATKRPGIGLQRFISISWRAQSCVDSTSKSLSSTACRFCALCDSYVAQSALAKGRSPSRGLRHVARQSFMIFLAAGLYAGSLFCPTRAIPADHPRLLCRDSALVLDFGKSSCRCGQAPALQMGRCDVGRP